MSTDRELQLLRMLREMASHLEDVRDEDRLFRYALRAAQEHFAGAHACLAALPPGRAGVELLCELPSGSAWDRSLIGSFLRGERPKVPFDQLIVPVRRRGRRWAALILRRREGEFERGEGRELGLVAAEVTELLDRIDRERVLEVRGRIDRKIMEQLRPRDLFYQILDALRTLTRYDHSSALLVATDSGGALELAAEQVAWLKGPSRRIGMKLPLRDDVVTVMRDGGVHGFRRDGDAWRGLTESAPVLLAELLDYNRLANGSDPAPRETVILCAPLATRHGVIGVIKVAALETEILGGDEMGLLGQFTSQASVAIQYLQRTESLKSRMLEAERKHAMADIARGVSHDVNNALGSILPLVQQMRSDAESEAWDRAVWMKDLAQIEDALQVCRRIFGNLLSFARDSAGQVGHGNLRRAVEGTLAILRSGLERRGIKVDLDIAHDLPLIRGGQGDLEQLVLNLSTNARDAMPSGGRMIVAARPRDGSVEVSIRDTGCGIAEASLPRIYEPFFTTKPSGNGLGLSICRSIVWSLQGDITVESEVGTGTTVRFRLPAIGSGEAP